MGLTGILTAILLFLLFYGKVSTTLLLLLSTCTGVVFLIFRKKLGHHGAFLSIDLYAQRSKLSTYHAGLKTGWAIVCALLCIAADSLVVSSFIVISMLFFTVCIGKTPLHYYISLLSAPLAFILLGTVAMLFEVSPIPLGLLDFSVGSVYIGITSTNQTQCLRIIGRAFGAVSCLYFLSLSTPLYQILNALRKVKLPSVVIELMLLIYRYIFVMLETHNQIVTAGQSRLGYRNIRLSLRTMLRSSLNLLFLSFRRTSDYFTAMEARCYDGVIAFWEEETALGKAETAVALGYIGILIILWFAAGRYIV